MKLTDDHAALLLDLLADYAEDCSTEDTPVDTTMYVQELVDDLRSSLPGSVDTTRASRAWGLR